MSGLFSKYETDPNSERSFLLLRMLENAGDELAKERNARGQRAHSKDIELPADDRIVRIPKMAQQIESIGGGQRRVVSEKPAASTVPFDQSSQPPLGGLSAMAGRNRAMQQPGGTLANPMGFPGINQALQARMSDPNLTDEQRMMLMLLLRQAQ